MMTASYTPSGRLFVLLTLLAGLGVACFVWDWMALAWLACLMLTFAGMAWEIGILARCRMHVEGRHCNPQPTVQRPFRLTLSITAVAPSPARFSLRAIESDRFYHVSVTPEISVSQDCIQAIWEVTARERGNESWPGAVAGYRTPLGLVYKWQTLPPVEMKVYPKLNDSLQTLLNPNLLLEQMGLKHNRYRRSDQVFESLRPYQLGDNYRHIDWKASARSGGLISRVFQMEQHHNIVVALDSSRLMGTVTEGITKLDWAIEASLHLAYLADYLKDHIGLLVFSSGVDQWVRPHRQPVEAFLSALYDVKCRVVEADLNAVCANILAHQKKRSLVIFLSDFIDASSLQPFLPSFAHLNRKHSTLFIGIEDPAYRRHLSLDAALPGAPLSGALLPDGPSVSVSPPDAVTSATSTALAQRIVAQDSMNRREAVLQELRRLGLRAITTTPETLVARAVNAYLEIKLSGAI